MADSDAALAEVKGTDQLDEGDSDDDIGEDDEDMEEGSSDSHADEPDDADEEAADAEAEAALEREIGSLRRQLEANPFHYESHVRLIELQRRAGDLDGMRAARERMHAQYPLSPQLWLDWIGDERKLLTDGEAASGEQAAALDGLFRRALEDYASVDVAAEYCVYAIGQQKLRQRDESGGGGGADAATEGVRQVFEHCAALVGRFAGRGDQRVWEAWREFELLELARAEATAAVGAAAAEAATAAVEQQRRRLLDVFRRHLAMPHVGLDSTWQELLDWLAGSAGEGEAAAVPAELRQAFERSREELTKIQPFEDRLADEPDKSGRHFRDYIASALGGPAQQLAVFERAVSANCLDTGLWESFVAYVWEQFEPGPKLQRLCQRAVRNCPWSGGLWRQLALCQECVGARFAEEIRPTYEAATAAGLTDPADLLAVWLAYLDAARRQVLASGDSWDGWHRLCERALAALDDLFGPQAGDPQASLLRYAALVRAKRGELGQARQLWDQVMKRGHGNSAQMWLRQLEFELRFGDPKHVRRCLGRAVNSVSSGPDCEALLQRLVDFEREEGDVSTYVEALKRARRQRLLLHQRAEELGAVGGGKRKAGKAAAGEQVAAKRPRPESQLQQRAPRADSAPQQRHQPKQGDAGDFKRPLPPPSQSPPQPPGSSGGSAKPQKAPGPAAAGHGAKVEHDPSKDHRTVFVSNMAFDVDEAAVRAALGDVASDITNLRLVRDYRGRSKGFAYVEFKSGAAAYAARKLDRTPINGRPMFVSECRTGGGIGGGEKREFQFEVGLERNKLFVSNLPRVMDQSAFAAMCSAQLGFRAARLAVYRSGASKGHGYAEFVDAAAAARAILAMDGLQVGDCQLAVAISNPPARREPGAGGAGGGGSRRPQQRPPAATASDPLATDPNRHRTKVSLVPRQLLGGPAVAAASGAPAATAAAAPASGGSGGGGMSNEDFRKMFFHK